MGCRWEIAGSIVDQDFLQSYLGMRSEVVVDMSEIARRVEQEIFDKDEFNLAKEWVKENCKEEIDTVNPKEYQRSAEQRAEDWDYVIKMVMIGRDLMIGNEKLASLGFEEEAQGHNAIFSGFQGQRQWTDFRPNGDFMETMLTTKF